MQAFEVTAFAMTTPFLSPIFESRIQVYMLSARYWRDRQDMSLILYLAAKQGISYLRIECMLKFKKLDLRPNIHEYCRMKQMAVV